MKREEFNEIIKNVSLLGQLGLSVIMPLLLCMGACWLLNNRCNVGLWVYIPGFILGIGAGFMTAYKFYLAQIHKEKKENRKKKVAFNRHI